VIKVEWSPFQSGILASCGMDRRVIVWDISLQGKGEIPNALVNGRRDKRKVELFNYIFIGQNIIQK
jgi:WD40 repeat protein